MKLRMFLSVALFGLFSMSASAQSFGDLLKKVTSGTSALSTAKDYVVSLLGTDKVTAADLSGTWSYSEPAVVFESENVVSKLGGAALAQSTEKQLASLLEKIGLEAGKIQLTFNEDRCKGCGLCISVCPKKILRLSENKFNKEGYTAVECIDMSQCIGCAMCATMCPDVVIRVEK